MCAVKLLYVLLWFGTDGFDHTSLVPRQWNEYWLNTIDLNLESELLALKTFSSCLGYADWIMLIG